MGGRSRIRCLKFLISAAGLACRCCAYQRGLHDSQAVELPLGGREARRCAESFRQCPDGPLPGCLGAPLSWDAKSKAAPQVSFALVTGAKYVEQQGGRPWAQLKTWLSAEPEGSWAYFSDRADDRLPALEVPGTSGGWGPSQRKWLGLLARLAAGDAPFDRAGFFPRGAAWLFVGDDDTFVWPDALRDRLQGLKHNPDDEALYMGLPDSGIAKAVGIDIGEAESYCLGGAGFLLSRKAADSLRGQDPNKTCADLFDDHGHSDVAMARCLARAVGITGCSRFGGLNQDPFPFNASMAEKQEWANGAEGDYPTCPPVSFHWMKPEMMTKLWAAQQ